LNKQVDLEVLRNGKPLKVKTQIKEQPIDYQSSGVSPRRTHPQPQPHPPRPGQPSDKEAAGGPLASIHVEELTPETARQLDLPANVQGVLVSGVDPNSAVPK